MGKTVTVSDAAQLYAALRASAAGDTIKLAAGNYGNFALSAKSGFDLNFEGVTLVSADPDRPAVFSGMNLTGVSNLTIDNVVFDYTFQAGQPSHHKPFGVYGGANITIRNSVFDGDVATGVSSSADGYGYAHGLYVRGTSGFTLADNEFHTWLRGAVFGAATNLTITGNEVHSIRSDGMNFVDVQRVLIEGNHFHDFRASPTSGDHRDMIQFWTNGSKQPSTDVVIRGNLFDIGAGSFTQTIFMRNEEVDTGRAGTSMYYRNILIEENTIYNAHLHGITVGETAGLTIRNNSLIAVPDQTNPDVGSSALWIPTIRVAPASTGVSITGNATAGIAGQAGQADWTVKGNAFIQNTNPFGPGYYGDVFVTSSMTPVDGAHAFVARPGGMLDLLGAGSQATRAPDGLGAGIFFEVTRGEGGAQTFDAGLTAALLGAADAGARYLWTFGDGSTAQGKVVNHVFAEGGRYDVGLTVTLADGRSFSTLAATSVRGPQVLSYDAAQKAFVAHDQGNARLLAPLTSTDGDALQLVATGVAASVWRGHLGALRGSDDFAIDFSIKADRAGSAGEVFRLHGSFIATVTASGALAFQIFDAAGKSTWVQTKGVVLNSGATHDVAIRVEGGLATIRVNGTLAAETAFAGKLPTAGSWDLTFGNPWNKANFLGDIAGFTIRTDLDDYPPRPVTTVLVPDSWTPPPAPEAAAGPSEIPVEATMAAPAPAMVTDPGITGLALDIGALAGTTALKGDTHVALRDGAPALVFDGAGDYVNLGRRPEYEHYDRIAFAVDFTRAGDMTGEERLVWNHMKVGLSLVDDGLRLQVATADRGLVSYDMKGLGLRDSDPHSVAVLLDTRADRLQVILDDRVVLEREGIDYHLAGAGGRDWGWMIGTPWNRFFEGEVTGFQLGDRFDFLGTYAAEHNGLLG